MHCCAPHSLTRSTVDVSLSPAFGIHTLPHTIPYRTTHVPYIFSRRQPNKDTMKITAIASPPTNRPSHVRSSAFTPFKTLSSWDLHGHPSQRDVHWICTVDKKAYARIWKFVLKMHTHEVAIDPIIIILVERIW